jgi:hypothetical protein
MVRAGRVLSGRETTSSIRAIHVATGMTGWHIIIPENIVGLVKNVNCSPDLICHTWGLPGSLAEDGITVDVLDLRLNPY